MAIATPHPVIDAAGGDDQVIASADRYAISILVSNPATSGATVFLGPVDVSDTGPNKGYPLAPGEAVSIDLDAGETLYGAVAAGSVTLDILKNRGQP